MALVTDTLYSTSARKTMRMRVANGVQVYAGSLLGLDRTTGLTVLWSDAAGIQLLGLSERNVLGDTTVGDPPEAVIQTGWMTIERVTIAGVASVADQGDLVYATDDGTFTKTPTVNVGAIGFIGKYYGGAIADIRLFSPEEYQGQINADLVASITTFLGLTDTPNSYAGQGGKTVKVNALGTGLEFVTVASPATDFLGLSDTPDSYTTFASSLVRVNAGETALEFVDETSDFLTQYALLAGRAGGQTLTGGTAGGNSLTLRSNSVSPTTTGFVLVGSLMRIQGGGGGAPGLSFSGAAGDNATGIGSVGSATSGILDLWSNGLQLMRLTVDNISGVRRIQLGADGDATNPILVFTSVPGQGWYKTASGWGWAQSSQTYFELAPLQITIDGVPLVTDSTATRAALRIGSLAGDPSSPANGDINYNSTSNKFRAYENGAWVDMIGGSLTFPILGDDGSAAAPTYSFSSAGNSDTGVFLSAANALGLSAGGIEALTVETTGVTVTGKLTVTGSIDPTDIILSGGGTAHFMEFGAGSTAAVSPSGTMRIVYDEVADEFQVSKDGGAYAALSGGGPGSDTTALHQGGDSFGTGVSFGSNDGFNVSVRTGNGVSNHTFYNADVSGAGAALSIGETFGTNFAASAAPKLLVGRSHNTITEIQVRNDNTGAAAYSAVTMTAGGGNNQLQLYATSLAGGSGGAGSAVIHHTGSDGGRFLSIISPNMALTATAQFIVSSPLVRIGATFATPNFQLDVEGGTRTGIGAPASAPADGDLENGQFSAWIDEGSDLLTIKVKYSGGTVKSGTVALA